MANKREITGRQFLGILFLRSLLGLAVAASLAYLIDAAVLRFRVATNRNALSTVTVRPYYAVDRKDKKTEFLFSDPQEETCVNSPCWYLRRHTDEEIRN
jgi:hypothetical protein